MGIKLKINNIIHLVNSLLLLFGCFNPHNINRKYKSKRKVENLDINAGVNSAGFDRMLGLIHGIVVSREVS